MKLLDYFIKETLNICICYFLSLILIKSFMDGEYICLLYTFLLSIEIDSMATRLKNFKKYYPNFEDKWINLI
jgi:hypothetical protein